MFADFNSYLFIFTLFVSSVSTMVQNCIEQNIGLVSLNTFTYTFDGLKIEHSLKGTLILSIALSILDFMTTRRHSRRKESITAKVLVPLGHHFHSPVQFPFRSECTFFPFQKSSKNCVLKDPSYSFGKEEWPKEELIQITDMSQE